MRIAFFGSSSFALPALGALLEAGHDIAGIYSQPSRKAGRGHKPRPTPVASEALARGLPLFERAAFRCEDSRAEFAALEAELAIIVAYGALLPAPLLDILPNRFLNIHPSLLPRWRGAAPIQRAIMAGDTMTGVCIMHVTEDLDAGHVLASAVVEITESDTAGSLAAQLSRRGAALLVDLLMSESWPDARPQAQEGILYAAKIGKDETMIDWHRTAREVDCHIRGLAPAPGAWTTLADERLKILDSRLAPGHGQPGEVLGDDLVIACRDGAVRALTVQRPGRKAMAAHELLRGLASRPAFLGVASAARQQH